MSTCQLLAVRMNTHGWWSQVHLADLGMAARAEGPAGAGAQEKLRLEEDDEVAIEWMQQLINESSSQVMANIMETTHRWAQALR